MSSITSRTAHALDIPALNHESRNHSMELYSNICTVLNMGQEALNVHRRLILIKLDLYFTCNCLTVLDVLHLH